MVKSRREQLEGRKDDGSVVNGACECSRHLSQDLTYGAASLWIPFLLTVEQDLYLRSCAGWTDVSLALGTIDFVNFQVRLKCILDRRELLGVLKAVV